MSEERNKEMSVISTNHTLEDSDTIPISAQPRQPRNLQDLLRYSTEAANALGETPLTGSFEPLDGESKVFLEEALKSMTVDVIEELLKQIKILQKASLIPEDGDLSECVAAFNHIFDFVDNLDVANDFQKIGGFCVIKPCLASNHSSLRWRAAELVAELCQNNPYCQSKMLEINVMPSLLQMIDTDIDDTVRVKALHAVSCLVRENSECFKEFIKNDGFSVLLRALQTDLPKLNIKSAFLLSSLCHWRPQIKDDLVNMGYVQQLISQLASHIEMKCNEKHLPSLEYLLSIILNIIRDHSPALEIVRKPELQFKSLLDYILKNSEGSDQYQEVNDNARDLIKVVFGELNSDEKR